MRCGCSSLQANRNRRRHCNLHPDPRPHHHPSLCWRAMHNSTYVAIFAGQENSSTLIALCMENRQATSPLLLSQGLLWLESDSHCDPQPDKTNTCNETKPDKLYIYIMLHYGSPSDWMYFMSDIHTYIYIYINIIRWLAHLINIEDGSPMHPINETILPKRH